MGIFSQEGKLVGALNKIGDLIWLNVLTIICCIPVVTAGAALTSMYQITLKMVRNEEGKVTPAFFRAMKENIKRSTAIWAVGAGVAALLYIDFRLMGKSSVSFAGKYQIVLVVLMALVLLFTYVTLVVSARYENSLKNTVRNGMLFGVLHFVPVLLMLAVTAIPVLLLMASYWFLAVDALIGLSGPAFLASVYFRDLFEKNELKQSECALTGEKGLS